MYHVSYVVRLAIIMSFVYWALSLLCVCVGGGGGGGGVEKQHEAMAMQTVCHCMDYRPNFYSLFALKMPKCMLPLRLWSWV